MVTRHALAVLLAGLALSACFNADKDREACNASGRCLSADGGSTGGGSAVGGGSAAGGGTSTGGGGNDSGTVDAGDTRFVPDVTCLEGKRSLWLDAGIFHTWAEVSAEYQASIAAGKIPDAGEAEVTVLTGNVPASALLWGGTLAMDGMVIAFPRQSLNFVQFNPVSGDAVDLLPTVQEFVGHLAFAGGVLGFDGFVYGVPTDSVVKLARFDGRSLSGATFSMVGPAPNVDNVPLIAATSEWYGTVALDGYLYTLPGTAGSATRINLSCPTSWQSLPFPEMDGAGTRQFGGAQLSAEGKVVGIPNGHTAVVIIDPANLSATAETIGVGIGRWHGGVLALNNKIYGMPSYGGRIVEIDVAAKQVDYIDKPSGAGGTYAGGVLGPDGLIYAMPEQADRVMVIDPTARTASLIGPVLTAVYAGAVLLPDGRIVGIPASHGPFLIIDPHMKRPPSAAAVRSPWVNKF